MNRFKTFLLMAVLTGILMLIGEYVGGKNGMGTALVLAGGMNFFTYWFSDKIVLKMYGAKEIDESENPKLYAIVQNLCQEAGIPMPKIYTIPTPQPNAFATGRDPSHAAVAVTDGILNILNDDELEGVLGHELAHVKHRDILVSTIAATMAGAITLLARFAYFFGGSDEDGNRNVFAGLFIMIFSGLAASLIQMAVSRSREYMADEGGAQFSHKPWALANALRKLEAGVASAPFEPSTSNEAMAHMFIVNPFSAKNVAKLFSTHPPTAERIAKLEAMQDKLY